MQEMRLQFVQASYHYRKAWTAVILPRPTVMLGVNEARQIRNGDPLSLF